jgi:hypothetical protein
MNFSLMLYFYYDFAFSTTLLQAILRCYRNGALPLVARAGFTPAAQAAAQPYHAQLVDG